MKSVCLAALAFAAVALPAQAQDRTGTTTTTTRTTTTTSPTRATLPAPPPALPPAPPSLIIPGGAGDILNTPLSFRLAKITANITTDDGSPSDEVYVIATTVFLNWDKLWESRVFTNATRVYEDMNDGDFRSVNLPLWGDDGAPLPVRSPKDVIVMFHVMEHDNGAVFLAAPIVKAAVLKAVKNLNPGYSYSQMSYNLTLAMQTTIGETLVIHGGDDEIGWRYSDNPFVLSADDLKAARAGSVVKIPLVFTDTAGLGNKGKYTVEVQLSR
jgi:hypothetical protein